MSDFDQVKSALNIKTVIEQCSGQELGRLQHLPECPFCQGHDCFSIPKGKYYF